MNSETFEPPKKNIATAGPEFGKKRGNTTSSLKKMKTQESRKTPGWELDLDERRRTRDSRGDHAHRYKLVTSVDC